MLPVYVKLHGKSDLHALACDWFKEGGIISARKLKEIYGNNANTNKRAEPELCY